MDTAYLSGGAALPWLMARAVQLEATQRALAKGEDDFFPY